MAGKITRQEISDNTNKFINTISSLKTNVNLTKLFEFSSGDSNYTYSQGMTVTNEHIVIAVVDNVNEHNTWIYVFDKDTFELATLPHGQNPVNDRSFKHCNGMCYNARTNSIIIASGNDSTMYVLDADDFDTIDTISLSFTPTSIGYDYDTDQYVVKSGTTYRILNNSFETVSSFVVPNYGTTGQAIEVYNGLIYSSFVDAGTANEYQTNNDPAMANCGIILVYTFTGELIKSYLLQSYLGFELEGINYFENGKFIANYNMWNSKFGVYSLDLLPQETFNGNELDEINYGKKFPYRADATFYIDSTYTGNISDGSQNYPWKDFKTITKFIHNYKGTVTINCKGSFSNVSFVGATCSIVIQKYGSDTYCEMNAFATFWCSGHIKLIDIYAKGNVLYGSAYCAIRTEFTGRLSLVHCKIDHSFGSGNNTNRYGIYALSSKVAFYTTANELNNCYCALYGERGSEFHIDVALTGTSNINKWILLGSSIKTSDSVSSTIDGAETNLSYGSRVVYSEGVEPTLPSGADFNDYTLSGTYRIFGSGISATMINCPLDGNGKLIVEYLQEGTTIHQTAISRTNRKWFRTKYSGTWSAWKEVSKNIISSGSTVITTVTQNVPVYVDIDISSYGYSSAPHITVTADTSSPNNAVASVSAITANSFRIYGCRITGTTVFTAYWIAVGN